MYKFFVTLAVLVAVVVAVPAPEPKAKPQFLTAAAYSAPLLANPGLAYTAPLTTYSSGYIAPSVYSAGYSAYSPYAAAAGAPLVYV